MKTLLQDAWRVVLPSSFDSKSQIIKYALLPQFKTVVLSFVACAWEFGREILHPTGCSAAYSWRTWLLIVPQVMLLAAYFLQLLLLLRYKRRIKYVVDLLVLLLVPLAFCAALHSAFRTSVSMCCCSSMLCPMTAPDQKSPSGRACSLVFSNCYWGLLRKLTHFAATMAMLSPLIALRLSAYSINSQDHAARTHMARFLRKIQ